MAGPAAAENPRVFELGDFTLASGFTLRNAKLVYATYGKLASDRKNAILYPTSYGAQHTDVEWLIGPDGILDSTRYFVIVPNMFGNGLSTSPSHLGQASYLVTHEDNVRAQARLLDEVLGIETLALVYGWSMGAQQGFYWAVMHPERVRALAALCGTARTRPHNRVFLESLKAALRADPAWDGTRFGEIPDRGFRAFARVYASWAASQAFYRDELYLGLGFSDLDDYLVRGWEASYRRRHPADLIAMLETWGACDVANHARHRGDVEAALGSIRAKTLVMPSATDLYFTPEDCAEDARSIPGSRLLTIPSIWGHRAGNPYQNPTDARFIRRAVAELLGDQPGPGGPT
jgi:homoserine O-acetyltransferase